jgi:predicted nucleotidyltransferase
MIGEDVIEEAGRRLRVAAPGSRVILFGSHARGDTNRDSDLDFLVVEPTVEHEVEESCSDCSPGETSVRVLRGQRAEHARCLVVRR